VGWRVKDQAIRTQQDLVQGPVLRLSEVSIAVDLDPTVSRSVRQCLGKRLMDILKRELLLSRRLDIPGSERGIVGRPSEAPAVPDAATGFQEKFQVSRQFQTIKKSDFERIRVA